MKQIIAHPAQMGMILQSARKSQGISQADLAQFLDTSQSAVSRLEGSPESIKLAELLKMLHRYGLELTISERPRHGLPHEDGSADDRQAW